MRILAAILSSIVLVACGGGGGGSTTSSSSESTQFTLTPVQIPISAQDKLVTVILKQGTTNFAFLDILKNLVDRAYDLVIPTAMASQITPTLSTQATAKVVAGQVQLVSPIFSTTVRIPDPADSKKTIDSTVSVSCDTSSIPTSVHVNNAWALNLTTGDLLVNMDYPKSVMATYDKSTKSFSTCSFTYASGLFVVFSNGTVSNAIDPALGETSTKPGCSFDPTFFRVIAAGDPTRNASNVPLLNSLQDTSHIDGNTSAFSLGVLCGSVRAFDYTSSTTPTITKINFSNDVLPNNSSFAIDAVNIYAIGSDRSYGGDAVSAACPVSMTKIGASGSTCIDVQNSAAYISYPISAAQLQTAGSVQKPFPSLFLGSAGTPMLSLQTYSGLCRLGSCVGSLSSPAIFGISPNLSIAEKISTLALDNSGYRVGSSGQAIPVGISNDYFMFSMGGSMPSLLVNISNGSFINICVNVIDGYDAGCGHSVNFGNFVYGAVGCAISGNAIDLCIGSPSIDRVNTLTGAKEHWDLKSRGYLLLTAMHNSSYNIQLPVKPIFYTDQVVFLACPSPNLDCTSPNWVSLNFATGQISAITTGGITFDMLPTLIKTTL